MRSTGIRRKVDDLGRVVIPAGIRRSLDIREGDEVEVHVDGEHVILAKPAVRCVFCGTEDAPLQAFRERQICRGCVASVGVLDETLRERAREAATQPTASGWQPPAAVIEDDDAAVSAPRVTLAPAPTPVAAAPREPERADLEGPPEAPGGITPRTPAPEPATAATPMGDAADTREDARHVGGTEDETDDLYDPASTTAW